MNTKTTTEITESIGKWGTITSLYDETRRTTIRPGDVIEFAEEFRRYPVSNRYCRVSRIDSGGLVHIVNGMGSAFLDRDGNVDISGGPFFHLPIETLQPTHELSEQTFWNWGPNYPGAGMGIDYQIARPVFAATASDRDFELRYSHHSEQSARDGGEYRHRSIPDQAKLVRTWDEHDGMTVYLFDLRQQPGPDKEAEQL